MAPLTTAEIIANADYLTDEFDPKSLTVPQLLGVFSHHGIRYSANAKKSQLLEIFQKEIRGNIDDLREQRMALDGSQASDRGITDGLSGRQINDPEVRVHLIDLPTPRPSNLEIDTLHPRDASGPVPRRHLLRVDRPVHQSGRLLSLRKNRYVCYIRLVL